MPSPAVLVPLPALLRAKGALPDDAHELVLGLRALDPLAPPALVSPTAARPRLEASLASHGYARLEGAPSPGEGTPAAGIGPDAARRLLKAPLDVWELSPAARPLAALGLTPTTARAAAASTDPAWALALERLARERDLESIGLVLSLVPGEPSPAFAAYLRHRVALARPDAASLAQAARALRTEPATPVSPAAREALGFAARLLLPGAPGAAGIDGAPGRELDLALADLLLEAAAPASGSPLDSLEPDAPTVVLAWPAGVSAIATALRDPRAPVPVTRGSRAAIDLTRALFVLGQTPTPAGPAAVPEAHETAAATLGSLGLAPEPALAVALGLRHALGLAAPLRRHLHRSLARGLDGPGRALVEGALPELAGLDALVALGLESAAKASSRAELVSLRRRAAALALARTSEVAAEPAGLRAELDRARAALEGQAELDWELVALSVEEALLPPDADRAPLAGRAKAGLERWAAAPERPPLGFLAPALRLLSSAVAESPFPGELKDPRRFEARALFHLARRAWKSAEVPREVVEAVLDRRRTGVVLSDLARKLDPTVTTALLFEGLSRELAASLSDSLSDGLGPELRLVRRLDAATLLGRQGGAFVRVRAFPEDDPPLESARALVRDVGSGPPGVARPIAALEAARVRGGLGVGWVLATALVEGARLLPEDLPRGDEAPGFVAALARALAAQHAWGLVHGPLRLDEIVLAPGGALAFADWDLALSLAPDAGQGRARDLEALLHAALGLGVAPAVLDAARASAGDLASDGAATRLASALDAAAGDPGRAALARVASRRSVDRGELRGLLRDALAQDALPRSLAEVEARVPSYLAYRGSLDQAALRDELLALAEEGWASGEFSLEIDARRGVFRLVEATS